MRGEKSRAGLIAAPELNPNAILVVRSANPINEG